MSGGAVVILFCALTAGIGFVFLCVSFLLRGVAAKRERDCTVHTVATVVDNVYSSYDSDAPRTWHAVFEYTAGGRSFRKGSAYGTTKPQFEVGQRVAIRYNPDRPDEYLVEEQRTGRALQRVFLAVGAGLLALGLALFLLRGAGKL